ncbi:uncharacterized protein TrAFT101_006450 [Trichoderma asperellum]|uniref:uncharacterized protein n=1 Tax=Trichoderma asperellum TaxID=101201 RepID=UPI0033219D21|nr:hypothetical protein TrAFT101_006450 [Trichoderma asperellum]
MKLALRIDHEFSPPSFRPGDSLRGTLEIRGCFFKHLPRITATLWGRLKVKASPDFNTCYPTEYNYMLFEQSKDLKILQPSPANDSPNGCVYLCPIEFKFPTGLNLERRILGKITKRKRVQRELLFSCNPIIIDLAASCTVALSADKLKQSFTRGSRDIVRPNLDESLPLYSPSLHMEIILPEPPLLIRGRGTPVRLMLHTPRELMQGADIYVRSVEIQMQTTMSAFLQPTWQNITETRHANAMNGAVQIKSEHFELNLGAWATFIVTQSRPSLNSCLLKIDYAIQVIAGISNGLESSIQYLKASLDVLVMDPPPTYQAAAHNMV